MKKLLLGIIIILIFVLLILTSIKGLKIFGVDIPGIAEIKRKNEELDTTIKEATKLASTDYQKKMDDLNEEIKKLQEQRTNYQDMVSVSTDSEVIAASQTYENMIDFLFIRIENHAKSEGVTIKMDVTRSSSGAENVYNLNFTATGTYAGIEEFITDVEDDSKLGFKIEEFRMLPSQQNVVEQEEQTEKQDKNEEEGKQDEESSNKQEQIQTSNPNEVQATFVCKNIAINGISANTNQETSSNEGNNSTGEDSKN